MVTRTPRGLSAPPPVYMAEMKALRQRRGLVVGDSFQELDQTIGPILGVSVRLLQSIDSYHDGCVRYCCRKDANEIHQFMLCR